MLYICRRNDFQKLASSVCRNNSPRNNNSRSKQMNALQMQSSHMSLRESHSASISPQRHNNSCHGNVVDSVKNVQMHQVIPSPTSTVKEMPRKLLKVRKVKSEMKYVEPTPKDSSKKKESKSDHEFANETDVSRQFQKEIYDILATYLL